jgi:hypothetical protein
MHVNYSIIAPTPCAKKLPCSCKECNMRPCLHMPLPSFYTTCTKSQMRFLSRCALPFQRTCHSPSSPRLKPCAPTPTHWLLLMSHVRLRPPARTTATFRTVIGVKSDDQVTMIAHLVTPVWDTTPVWNGRRACLHNAHLRRLRALVLWLGIPASNAQPVLLIDTPRWIVASSRRLRHAWNTLTHILRNPTRPYVSTVGLNIPKTDA